MRRTMRATASLLITVLLAATVCASAADMGAGHREEDRLNRSESVIAAVHAAAWRIPAVCGELAAAEAAEFNRSALMRAQTEAALVERRSSEGAARLGRERKADDTWILLVVAVPLCVVGLSLAGWAIGSVMNIAWMWFQDEVRVWFESTFSLSEEFPSIGSERARDESTEPDQTTEKRDAVLRETLETETPSIGSECTRVESTEPDEATEKRDAVLRETFETEESYLKSLTTLVTEYVKQLKEKQSQLNISDQDIKNIFGNVESIYGLHSQLFEMAQVKPLCEVFCTFGPFFKIYSDFINGYDNSVKCLKELQKSNKSFRLFIQSSTGPEPLQALMITPIQRIPRYILLLKELDKCTPEDHPERKSLTKALETIQAVAAQLNEEKRRSENMEAIRMLQKRVRGRFPELLIPSRVLIRQDLVTRKAKSMVIARKSGILFMFNDLLLLASKDLHYKGHLFFSEIDGLSRRERHNKWWLDISMKVKDGPSSSRLPLCIAFDSESKRENWIESLLKNISHN